MPEAASRYYYLDNFRSALSWLCARYEDLLAPEERRFVEVFSRLPLQSAALLVRMISRRGEVFRTSRLVYAEIGCPHAAASPLVEKGLIDPQPALGWAELQRLLTKAELAWAFDVPVAVRRASKAQLVAHLQAQGDEAQASRALWQWSVQVGEAIYRLSVAPLCERLRLVFFGNFRQDWSEFVLTDLGIHRYESVAIDARARAFRRREEIDRFFALYGCREQLRAGAPAEQVLAQMPPALADCDWIESRRARLQFQLAQQLERTGQWSQALDAYLALKDPHAGLRAVRVLERQRRWQDAWDRLSLTEAACSSEPTRQLSERLRRRLGRRLGRAEAARRMPCAWTTFGIELRRPAQSETVEMLAAQHLASEEAPVFYVENTLMNSLLGLWCWEAIFAPVPGAFFHPFQAAPADLLTPQFCSRRSGPLDACRAALDSGEYRARIEHTFREKAGLASPFVAWEQLSARLLSLALECIAVEHLRQFFERILADIAANRAGLPDLIQFLPRERRYRLIEVKGPGDRLQNNQIRWLAFCASRGIEVAVCKVAWRS